MPLLNSIFQDKQPVRFIKKTSVVRNGIRGPVRCTFEIHQAANEFAARSFLRSKNVTLDQYYIVVETPSGAWVRNIDGIYKED